MSQKKENMCHFKCFKSVCHWILRQKPAAAEPALAQCLPIAACASEEPPVCVPVQEKEEIEMKVRKGKRKERNPISFFPVLNHHEASRGPNDDTSNDGDLVQKSWHSRRGGGRKRKIFFSFFFLPFVPFFWNKTAEKQSPPSL